MASADAIRKPAFLFDRRCDIPYLRYTCVTMDNSRYIITVCRFQNFRATAMFTSLRVKILCDKNLPKVYF